MNTSPSMDPSLDARKPTPPVGYPRLVISNTSSPVASSNRGEIAGLEEGENGPFTGRTTGHIGR